ncbi:HD domain-containing protein [Actinomycetota bacterium Odt1-20B]
MDIPSADEVRALHQKYAPTREAFEVVYTHCEIVWSIAQDLLRRFEGTLNADLVQAGCLLHDIGVYQLYDAHGVLDNSQYIRHGVLGHNILRAEGFPEFVCRFCSCHTGVGLSKHDVITQQLPLPLADYLAETAEERLVMYADKFHSKTNPPKFMSAPAYATYVQRFGDDKTTAFHALHAEFGDPDLMALSARFGHRIH